ncbi:MAG TPA: hypothetical protein VHQ90_02150 [Thermoanaerobaculia bacterium]|nr:hypothetical protein [Thermoanaerobaculia bacterium]
MFEESFATRHPSATGIVAMARLEAELPLDGVLFRAPGYKFLPSDTSSPAFAVGVRGLRVVDRDLFNRADVIVVANDLRFCCMYTHEVGALAEPEFWSAAEPGRQRLAPRPRPGRH